VSENKYVVGKNGEKVYTCNYRWMDPDGRVETCRAPKACEICGQCSRIDTTGHESGHCPGHLGLSEHIPVPGQADDKVKVQMDKARQNKPQQKRKDKRAKREVKVERRPSLKR
jgi:hypothetical protein